MIGHPVIQNKSFSFLLSTIQPKVAIPVCPFGWWLAFRIWRRSSSDRTYSPNGFDYRAGDTSNPLIIFEFLKGLSLFQQDNSNYYVQKTSSYNTTLCVYLCMHGILRHEMTKKQRPNSAFIISPFPSPAAASPRFDCMLACVHVVCHASRYSSALLRWHVNW